MSQVGFHAKGVLPEVEHLRQFFSHGRLATHEEQFVEGHGPKHGFHVIHGEKPFGLRIDLPRYAVSATMNPVAAHAAMVSATGVVQRGKAVLSIIRILKNGMKASLWGWRCKNGLANPFDGLRHPWAGDEPVAVEDENPPLAYGSQFSHARTRCQRCPVRGRANNQNNVGIGLNESFRRKQDGSLGVGGNILRPGQFQQVIGIGLTTHGLQRPVKLKEYPLGVLTG